MKSQGYRRKTRSLLRRKARQRGKTGLSKILREYESGDQVVVKLNPSVHKGMPHRRFHGRVGIIKSKRGRAYVVDVTQGDALKTVTIRPEHLEPFKV
jgi:large subunit ribosomal protein L21e